ncbi:protein argonaute 2-like [Bidens hawaiensis]|uniref:protein argonaute 2-like n=1 Tax=Bidens hawaiensis TaxID=980011 RepID=UPI00404B629D
MVLDRELIGMKKAICTKEYSPFFTVVVAQKGHATRLFLDKRSGNVPPGTIVDTDIVHPTNPDFYLCSHLWDIGTSRPVHYTVISDGNGFLPDEMQKVVYHLCYASVRGTNMLSLVPPVLRILWRIGVRCFKSWKGVRVLATLMKMLRTPSSSFKLGW